MLKPDVLSRSWWISAVVLALLTIGVYAPGLNGGFAFDDYPNIVENAAITEFELSLPGVRAVVESGIAGPFKRPLPMLSFALNFHFAGLAPFAYKLTNLAIHVINGWLVLLLVRELLASPILRTYRYTASQRITIAGLSAGLWLVHPLNLTSVLFVVQRMNSLAAAFSLLAIVVYCSGRRRLVEGESGGRLRVYGAFPLCVALGALCKENALLCVPLAAVVEWCCFRFRTASAIDRRLLVASFTAALAVPAIVVIAWVVLHPQWFLTPSGGRGFTPFERGLTEARVLLFYLSMWFAPRLGELGLYHDDFVLSTGLLNPATTLPAVVAIVVLLIASVVSVRRFPLAAFPVLWFAVGHAMESSVLPLELVHEHRNYLPGVALGFGAACALVSAARGLHVAWLPRFAGVAAIALFAAITFLRAGDWSDPVTLATIEAQRNPESFRTVYELGRVQYGLYLMHGDVRDFERSLATLERAASLDESTKRPLLEIVKLSYRHGLTPRREIHVALIERYANGLFRHNDWVDLQRLVGCRLRGECRVPHALIVEAYGAALRNDTITPYARAQVMADFAVFYANALGEYEPAIALLDDAIAVRPDETAFRLLLAETLVLAGRDARAAAELGIMAQQRGALAPHGRDARRVDELRQKLERRAASRPRR